MIKKKKKWLHYTFFFQVSVNFNLCGSKVDTFINEINNNCPRWLTVELNVSISVLRGKCCVTYRRRLLPRWLFTFVSPHTSPQDTLLKSLQQKQIYFLSVCVWRMTSFINISGSHVYSMRLMSWSAVTSSEVRPDLYWSLLATALRGWANQRASLLSWD